MNVQKPMPVNDDEAGHPIPFDRDIRSPGKSGRAGKRRSGAGRFGGIVLFLLGTGLAFGMWQHHELNEQVMATAEQRRAVVPAVRVAAVRASGETMSATLPGTTEAFEAANIYSRTSGYVAKRYVDIGDHVTTGALLAEITAPELDHQIAQAQATLAQNEAALRQAQANKELSNVTWGRGAKLVQQGWLSEQQGDQERLGLEAQQANVAVAQANIEAQQAHLRVLDQQKAYQRVVAPFDGVVTARNIDNGSLVQADATGGTSMFTMMHSDVIRIQLYVPQDQAFGLQPGVEGTVRVPEMPGVEFRGTVTRVANALAPGTRTLLTEIDVPNTDGRLTPGTYCDVELKIPRKVQSLIVPSEAVIFDRTGLRVAVVEDGVVHRRKIREVRDFGTTIEVNDGVKAGDQVILNPPVDLPEEQKVDAHLVPPPK
jgi:RND family efflux transporter MFP subunit